MDNSQDFKVKTRVFFSNLDGLRFIAFAFVFLQHGFGNIFIDHKFENSLVANFVNFLFVNGGTGVSIFFVLSGFLITYLILTEIESRGKLNLKYFYVRRTLRIWPLYFFVVIFAFEVYPFLKSIIGIYSNLCSQSIYYYFFLSNFDSININHTCPGKDAMIEGITWSVAIEEQFYLIWPLFFLVFPKKYFVFIFYLVIAISLVFRLYNSDDNAVLYFHTLSVCADLAVGGLGAYYSIKSTGFRDFFVHLHPKILFLIYCIGIAFCVLEGLPYLGVVNRLLSTLFFLFIILEQNFNITSSFKFSKFKLLSKAGKYTYGYYLLHPMAILLVSIIFRLKEIKLDSVDTKVLAGFFSFLITLFVGYVSYHYFEKYFIKVKSGFSFITKE